MTFKERLAQHALICGGIYLVITLLLIFSPKAHVGFFGYIALLIFGTIFTTIGVSVGDVIRRFVMPDAILTSDAMDTFKKKVFWKIGPQAIGWFIGFMATNGMMRNVLGYTQF